MAEIIDHMRIYTRSAEGMSNEMIDIGTLLQGPFKLLDQQLKNHNVEVVKEFDPELPKVAGNPIRLEQVFLNLINNARNALDDCGKEGKRMEIRTYHADNPSPDNGRPAVVVEIRDNGDGVPEHLKEKIFQPFFTTKEPGKGTGLGLSVSSKIIEEHRGRIELESNAGQGTTFKVILPAGGDEPVIAG
jgi:signal transduction histidine kinase